MKKSRDEKGRCEMCTAKKVAEKNGTKAKKRKKKNLMNSVICWKWRPIWVSFARHYYYETPNSSMYDLKVRWNTSSTKYHSQKMIGMSKLNSILLWNIEIFCFQNRSKLDVSHTDANFKHKSIAFHYKVLSSNLYIICTAHTHVDDANRSLKYFRPWYKYGNMYTAIAYSTKSK